MKLNLSYHWHTEIILYPDQAGCYEDAIHAETNYLIKLWKITLIGVPKTIRTTEFAIMLQKLENLFQLFLQLFLQFKALKLIEN